MEKDEVVNYVAVRLKATIKQSFTRNEEGRYDVNYALIVQDDETEKDNREIVDHMGEEAYDKKIGMFCCPYCGSLRRNHVCKPTSVSENEMVNYLVSVEAAKSMA